MHWLGGLSQQWWWFYLELRSVLAMVGVVARVVIKVKIDIKNGFGIWLF
ncbi:hypothetical protein BSPWISOXPB_3945 [uncultured Gammaproteobacteria bacterium]|nr:hypothetical protein BSPWISOXPB_3945 [uncultured Gammaproteobacteria bacterium]